MIWPQSTSKFLGKAIAHMFLEARKMRFYAGVGSRRAPPPIEFAFKEVVLRLNDLGYTARSGGASGPDSWVEKYAKRIQVFLPYSGFNGSDSILCAPTPEAFEIASKVHPAWDRLTDPVRRLHARNVHQVLGAAIRDTPHLVARPSDFVLCWTPGGQTIGGTATAIRVAQAYNIPVFNLADDEERDLFRTERVLDQVLALVEKLYPT